MAQASERHDPTRVQQRLFPAGFVASLARYRLRVDDLASRAAAGGRIVHGAPTADPASMAFREYRAYSPGDDLRHLDWNAYARLGSLVIKRFEATGEVVVDLVIDRTASMDYGAAGAPTLAGAEALGRRGHKFTAALRLAAALGVVGLLGHDAVRLRTAPHDGPRASRRDGAQSGNGNASADAGTTGDARSPLFSGRQSVQRLLDALAGLTTQDAPLDLDALLARATRQRRRLWMPIISDFQEPEAWFELLERLRARRAAITCFHLIAPAERVPPIDGALSLASLESAARGRVRLDVNPSVVRAYQELLERHVRRVSAFCHEKGIGHWLIHSDVAFDSAMFHGFKRRGLWV